MGGFLMFTPGGGVDAAARLVTRQCLGDHLGKQRWLGAFGLGVHGAGPVVVVQDLSEVVRGGVFGAAPQLVDRRCRYGFGVLVVGLLAQLSCAWADGIEKSRTTLLLQQTL